MRVDAYVDDRALRRVLAVLRRAMITPPAGVRVYLACGYTDMRKGMATLAMLVRQRGMILLRYGLRVPRRKRPVSHV